MSQESNHKLIYDFVDGQLSDEQIPRAKELIANDPKSAELYETLRGQQERLRALPQYSLDDSFADRVVSAAQAEDLFDRKLVADQTEKHAIPISAANSTSAAGSQPAGGFVNWRGAAAAIVALAALILVTLFIIPATNSNPSSLAAKSEETKSSKAEPSSASVKEEQQFSDRDADQELAKDSLDKQAKVIPFGSAIDDFAEGAAEPSVEANPQLEPMADFQAGAAITSKAEPGRQRRAALSGARSPQTLAQEAYSESEREKNGIVAEESLENQGRFLANRDAPAQILLVNLNRGPQSMKLLEKTFNKNGLEFNLSEEVTEGLGAGLAAEAFDDDSDERAGAPLPPSELAFNVRTTPDRMLAMMTEFSDQADVLGVDSATPFAVDNAGHGGGISFADSVGPPVGTKFAANQLPTMRLDKKRNLKADLLPADDFSNKEIDRDGEADAARSDEGAEQRRMAQSLALNQVRELNQFFGLEPDEGVQKAQQQVQNYTLVFRFQAPPLAAGANIPMEAPQVAGPLQTSRSSATQTQPGGSPDTAQAKVADVAADNGIGNSRANREKKKPMNSDPKTPAHNNGDDLDGLQEDPAANEPDSIPADMSSKPIINLGSMTTSAGAALPAQWDQPAVIKSAEEAANFFDEDELASVTDNIDFANHHLLIFAWQGSGRDRLEHVVMESYPEQIGFSRTMGRTRDLRQHIIGVAVRKNVSWSTN